MINTPACKVFCSFYSEHIVCKNRIPFQRVLFMLRAESRASASGQIGIWRFNPNHYPRIRWRWKIFRCISGAHGRNKETDDYAMRIFIMFRGNPEELSFWDKIRNSALNLFYGFDPPHSVLSYVWSNVMVQDSSYNSPYSNQVKI